METQPPETRLKVLETSYARLDERVTTHGKEIDAITEQLVRTQERDAFRDKQMASVESKVDRIDGKIDLMAVKPVEKSAEKWDKATWAIVSGLIMAVAGYLASHLGL